MSDNTQPPLPGSAVSQIENDITQTFGLADTVYKAAREPLVYLHNTYRKRAARKRIIGGWQKEAREGDNEYLTPVLREQDFLAHLLQHDGVLDPTGDAPAKGGWAYFLHALAIRPGIGLVGWMPNPDGDSFNMEIDGAVFGHVVNLYRQRERYVGGDNTLLETAENSRHVDFPFGTLTWELTGGSLHAQFKPGTQKQLNSTRRPFDGIGDNMEPNTNMALYLNALEKGISDPKYFLPQSTAQLSNRISKLLQCIDDLNCGHRRRPILISYEWLKQATRIVRRALAGGGKDQSFYNDICEKIDKNTTWDKYVKATMKEELGRSFLFNEGMGIYVRGAGQSPPMKMWSRLIIMDTLNGYSKEPIGSWKHNSYLAKQKVVKLLLDDIRVYMGYNTWILNFNRSSRIWKEKVIIGA